MKVSVQDLLNHDYPMALARSADGDGFDGGCPCGTIIGDGFEVDFHCWRSSCTRCQHSGIHVSGVIDTETKQKIAEHIRDNNGWTNQTDWNIVIE